MSRPVVLLDSCVEGRESSEVDKLVRRVLEYGISTHKMPLTHLVADKTLNFLYFQVGRDTVITDSIIKSFMSEFKGSTLQHNKWKVPIAASRQRSLSPEERHLRLSRPDAWMYEVKMIIIYSVVVILLVLKLLDIK